MTQRSALTPSTVITPPCSLPPFPNSSPGTTNFVHGFPFVAISLGLIYKKRPVLGVIYNPFLDYLYSGIKGHGSYLSKNKQPAQKLPLSAPRPLPSLSQALIAVEWGSDRSQTAAGSKAESFLRLTGDPNHASPVKGGKMAHSLRSLGSAALNFSMVAQGGMDMYWYATARPAPALFFENLLCAGK